MKVIPLPSGAGIEFERLRSYTWVEARFDPSAPEAIRFSTRAQIETEKQNDQTKNY